MAVVTGGGHHSWWMGSRETGNTGREQGKIKCKGHTLSDSFPQSSPDLLLQREKLGFNPLTRKARQSATREVLPIPRQGNHRLSRLSISLLSIYIPSSAEIKVI